MDPTMDTPRRLRLALALACLLLPAAVSTAEGPLSIEERSHREVVQLHNFLEWWSNATLPDTDEGFARFESVIAPGFLLIDPDGSTVKSQTVIEAIRGAHGRWRDSPGKIRIENFKLHHASGALTLATYEEWHDLGEASNGRLSTVLFGANQRAPNGLVWLHLHEVWLEMPQP